MEFYAMIDTVNALAEDFLTEETNRVKPEKIGLDKRSAYELLINEDVIVTSLEHDRDLQYYGGFEYVDYQHRTQVGDYIFYSGEDERVQEHIQKWINSK